VESETARQSLSRSTSAGTVKAICQKWGQKSVDWWVWVPVVCIGQNYGGFSRNWQPARVKLAAKMRKYSFLTDKNKLLELTQNNY